MLRRPQTAERERARVRPDSVTPVDPSLAEVLLVIAIASSRAGADRDRGSYEKVIGRSTLPRSTS